MKRHVESALSHFLCISLLHVFVFHFSSREMLRKQHRRARVFVAKGGCGVNSGIDAVSPVVIVYSDVVSSILAAVGLFSSWGSRLPN